MRFARLSTVVVILGASSAMHAQQQATTPDPRGGLSQAQFVVKTVALRHLTSAEAVKLLEPYSQSAGGGVYEVSPNIRAVTIREIPRIFAEMMTVLAQYDREPATVTLNFQLIAAENTTKRDPLVASLDSLLRGVLKFTGYRLLNTSVASASENSHLSQSLSADGETFTLSVDVTDLRIDGNSASVHLSVNLQRNPSRSQPPMTVLSTGVTVPIGQTVVLGTSATSEGPVFVVDGVRSEPAGSAQRALILTVRPILAKR